MYQITRTVRSQMTAASEYREGINQSINLSVNQSTIEINNNCSEVYVTNVEFTQRFKINNLRSVCIMNPVSEFNELKSRLKSP